MERKNAWEKYDTKAKQKKVFDFAEEYRKFISENKTERECTEFFIEEAKKAGFKNLAECIKKGSKLKPGDKVYASNYGKALAMFVLGKKPLEDGLSILGAHIDSPRIDIKQNPLYEDRQMALLDTHYYGGIKKYQWVTLPLSLRGVVIKKDSTAVNIKIGDSHGDPVFGITDLLPHLAQEQMEKKANKIVEGEDLNILIGSMPIALSKKDKEDSKKSKDTVKQYILKLLKEKYDIEEEDFISAELEAVPAGYARDYGFDKSMIMGYGHDDRVCAYPSFRAMLEVEKNDKTLACLLVDKEEIGSVGATGMESRFFENCVAELIGLKESPSELTLRRCLANSYALSSDVSAAFDPNYPSVMEEKNAAFMGCGLVFNKFTGSRGKYDSNDANAEYMGKLRGMLEKDNVYYHTAELGKVDLGGGGTIAYILGNYGMNVIDSGVPVLSMHSPWEIISKVDLYEAYLGYISFLKKA